MYARGTQGQNLKQNHRGHYALIRVMEYFERSDDGKKKEKRRGRVTMTCMAALH